MTEEILVKFNRLVMPLMMPGPVFYKCNKCKTHISDPDFIAGFMSCNTCRMWTKDYSVESVGAINTTVA